MGDAHIQEASAVVNQVVGFSVYLHGLGYSVEKFLKELQAAVEHMKSQVPVS
jgi:hypothetical protein